MRIGAGSLVPEAGELVPDVDNRLHLFASDPLGAPVADAEVQLQGDSSGKHSTDAFELRNVAEYTSSTLGAQYKSTALWGSQAGSLLLWAWIFSGFSSLAVYTNRRRNRELMPVVVAVLMVIALFFLGLLSFVTSPFETLATVPAEGPFLALQINLHERLAELLGHERLHRHGAGILGGHGHAALLLARLLAACRFRDRDLSEGHPGVSGRLRRRVGRPRQSCADGSDRG